MIAIEAFKQLLERCFPAEVVPRKVLVALSGGVDSTCLTYLLSQYRNTYRNDMEIHAITIDHGYRQESAQEAAKVGQLVSQWGVKHSIVQLEYTKPIQEITNFELVARIKRYNAFQDLAHRLHCRHLFVAHNYNDQLETCMMRIQQRSTVFGLTGLKPRSMIPIPPQSPGLGIEVIRPLLLFEKSDIYQTCQDKSIRWFEDHTNKDVLLTDRNLFREALTNFIPLVLETNPSSPYKIVSRPMIEDTLHKAQRLVNYTQNQIGVLTQKLHENILLNRKNGLLKLYFPIDEYQNNGPLVLSRYFYQILYPISAIKNYHFSYTKVEQTILPNIDMAIVTGKTQKFTCLQLLFEVTATSNTLKFHITRQPILRDEVSTILHTLQPSDPPQWFLFDRRYWMQISGLTAPVKIVPYNPKLHAQEIKTQYGHKPPGDASTTPLLIYNGKYILPTYGYNIPNLTINWKLKEPLHIQ